MKNILLRVSVISCLFLWSVAAPPSAKANVYATNIKLNGSATAASIGVGGSLTISYILNQAATAGVTVDILSGGNTVRTIAVAAGNPGTLRGANSVIWDGKNGTGANVPLGTYSVRVTAGATGFGDWTQISDDSSPSSHIYSPRGIAVNQNTNSPYYGRVFIANAQPNTSGTKLGDQTGIIKANADGSFADEGGFSTGGWTWAGDGYSPWKIEVSGDDYVYINDWTGNGEIIRFDQQLTTNNYVDVLRADNIPAGGLANLSGPAIFGAGTNTQIYMADINYTSPTNGTGITRWTVTTNGACAQGDKGTQVVVARWPSFLNDYPYDVAVDANNSIYVIQWRSTATDSANRVMRFSPYSGAAETLPDWFAGSGDATLVYTWGIAVDPTITYVAVAVKGGGTNTMPGGVAIFAASNGTRLATTITPAEDHRDVAWDAVGNVYVCDNTAELWRTYTPPGTNRAVTLAIPTVTVTTVVTHPTFSAPRLTGGQFQFTLTGDANATYVIQSSTTLTNWTPVLTNTSSSAIRPLSVSAPTGKTYYRAIVQ